MSETDESALPPRVSGDQGATPRTPAAPQANQTWTVAALLQWTAQRFAAAKLPSPRTDAEYLLAHALGCSRMQLYVQHDMAVGAQERTRFREVVKRRLAHEPVAYIEGKRGFHALDLELAVDRRVLVPRPETELLVDWVVERLAAPAEGVAPAVVDIGTGSGAIALSLARARPDLAVTATDVSADALDVARANAERAELSQVTFAAADVYEGLATPDGGWAAIVSNPPYIDTATLEGLAPDVRDWEPRQALDGGPDGLVVIRRLVGGAAERLAPGGFIAFEIGFDQGPAAVALCKEHGLVDVQARKDHAGHDRMVMGRKLGAPAGG